MNNSLSNKLKKRTCIDTVTSCLLCITALAVSIYQLFIFLRGDGSRHLNYALYGFIVFIELGLLSLILLEIRKTGKPFSKKIIIKLRVMAIVIMAGVFIPSGFAENNSSLVITFDMKTVLIFFAGVIIGIISEIFSYGHSLQQDNDLIA